MYSLKEVLRFSKVYWEYNQLDILHLSLALYPLVCM